MSKDPLITIIIPTFNSESTISEAINSILNQTFTDYEILIMDGLSSDQTITIIKKYQLTNSNIKLYSEKDNGIYDAMNKGIIFSTGKWLYFMGSDDSLFDTNVLMKVYNVVKNSTYDVVYGNVNSSRHNGLYDGEFTYEKLFKKNICHQAIFAQRTVFEKCGTFDVTFKTVADWHHNIRWFYNHNIRHHFINLTVANYSDWGFSSKNRDEKFLDLKNELFFRYGFFKIPLKNLIVITTKIVKKHKQRSHYLNFFFYAFVLYCLKLKKGLN